MGKVLEELKVVPEAYICCDEEEFEQIAEAALPFAISRIDQFAVEMMDLLVYPIKSEKDKGCELALYMDARFYCESIPTEIQSIYFGVNVTESTGATLSYEEFSSLEEAFNYFITTASNYEKLKTNEQSISDREATNMDVMKTLQSLPEVSIEEKPLTQILATSPLEYGKANMRLFASQLEQLAYYSITKGESKNNLLYLYMDAFFDNEDIPTETKGVFFGIQEVGENGGDSHGTFDTLEEAVQAFQTMVMDFENLLVYRVYEAKLKDEDTNITFSVSSVREPSLKKEIEKGLLNIALDSMSLIVETVDRNRARELATEF